MSPTKPRRSKNQESSSSSPDTSKSSTKPAKTVDDPVVAAILQMSVDMQRAIKSIKARPQVRHAPAPRKAAPAPVEEEETDLSELFPFITDVLQEWNDARRILLKREV